MKDSFWQQMVDRPADLHSATLGEARLVVALRIAVFAHKSGVDPAPAVAEKLGSVVLGNHLSLIVEAMGQAWPETFSVMRPCCSRMSPDETLFAGMLRCAARGNRASFDRLTCEMIAEDARNLLFNLMRQISLLGAPLERAAPRYGSGPGRDWQ